MSLNPVTEILLQFASAVVVVLITRSIFRLYRLRSRLPPGPFPLPLIGNILCFRKPKFSHEVMHDLSKTYGGVYTLFLGHDANIIITDPHIGLQALKRHTFAGRPRLSFVDWFFKPDSTDIAFSDFGKEWEALRKVGHTAARKFAVSPQLPVIVCDAVDRMIAEVKENPFDSEEKVSILIMNILAQAAFGQRFEFTDPEFLEWRRVVEWQRENNNFLLIVTFLPFLRFFYPSKWKAMIATAHFQWDYIGKMYMRAESKFHEGKNDSFCDAMIAAKKETEENENWMLPYLKIENLHNAVQDLFAAGTDTTRMTMKWILMFMARHPEIQQKMREDIADKLAGSDPQIDDMTRLPLICAFLSEVLRIRLVITTTIPHKTTVDEELAGHKIPEGTTVLVVLPEALSDEATWGDPQEFRPERFLDEAGRFVSKPNNLYIPFSDGRRSCPGHKFAFNNMFLMITRLLQKTKQIEVVGGVTEEHMRGDLTLSTGLDPIKHSIKLTLR